MQPREWVGGDRVDDAGLDVARRGEVEGDTAGDELAAQLRIVDRARAVGDPLGLDFERPANLRRPTPFTGVNGDSEAPIARRLERPPVDLRIWVRLFGAGEVEPDQPLGPER